MNYNKMASLFGDDDDDNLPASPPNPKSLSPAPAMSGQGWVDVNDGDPTVAGNKKQSNLSRLLD
jgi:hypothetical protein